MAVQVTTYADDTPCPRAEVFITSGPAGAASVTVWRLAAGREYKVRGAVNAPFSGAFTRIDFEMPFGVSVVYRAEFFTETGASIGIDSAFSVRLDVADTWIHNPLDPQGAARVDLMDTAGATISRPVPGEVSRPIGRRVGVMLTRPRQGVTGLALDVATETFEEADRVQAMLGDYDRDLPPVICVRKGAAVGMRIPSTLFLGVLDITEEDIGVKFGREDTVQRMTGDETAPPIPGLFIPLLRRADINAFYASRAAIAADNLTRIAVNRRYDLAGVADA